MTTYHYSLATDFPDGFNQVNLIEEIADDENFSSGVQPLISILVTDDDIEVTMSDVIKPNDILRFISIATSHDPRPSIWKTISTSFPRGLNMSQLTRDITAVFDNTFIGILGYHSRDRVKLVFNSFLDVSQITAVTTLIAAHVPTFEPPRTQHVNLPIRPIQILNTYTLISRFQFVPSGNTLDYVDLLSCTNMATGRYQFKVVRADTKVTIGESDIFANTTPQVCSISAFVGMPTEYSILEIYVRRIDNTSTINIDQISFWHHTP